MRVKRLRELDVLGAEAVFEAKQAATTSASRISRADTQTRASESGSVLRKPGRNQVLLDEQPHAGIQAEKLRS